LKGLPARVHSGTSLPLQVEVQGAEPGKTVTISAWFLDQEIFRLDKVLAGPRDLAFSIPVPGLSGGSTLVVQARCEGAWSAPRVIQVLPSPGDPDAAPSGSKRARLPDHPGSASSAASAAGGGGREVHGLSALPQALKVHVAGFTRPGELRYVNKSLNRAAQDATEHLTISGPINDVDLHKLFQNHNKVRSITFRDTPDLSPRGIIEALKACNRLRELSNQGNKLKFPHLLELARTHETLVDLRFGELDDIGDEEIAALPERMRALTFRSTTVRDETIHRFQHLRALRMNGNHWFKGEILPRGLTDLTIENCLTFTGKELPPGLTHLSASNASGFTGPILLPRMRELTIKMCSLMTSERVLATVKGAPLLTHLGVDRPSRELIGTLPDGMISLALRYASKMQEGDFARFTRLTHLSLMDCVDFTGAHLPLSLEVLDVAHCPNFRSEGLGPVPLRRLSAAHCGKFTGAGLPGSLVELEVDDSNFLLPTMMTTLGHLDRLQRLRFRGWWSWDYLPDSALFQAHPALRTVEYSRDGTHYYVWHRLGPPPAPAGAAPAPAAPGAAGPPPAAAAAAGP
jgi:hypothetical protein